jgi:hypothetical protein
MGPVSLHLHVLHLVFFTLLHAHSSILCLASPSHNEREWSRSAKVGPAGLTFGRNFLKIFMKFF